MERGFSPVDPQKRARYEAKHPAAAHALRRRKAYVWRLGAVYGMAHADYQQLVAIQRGRCAICGMANRALGVDHCHQTERVRGLLCSLCNLVLGQVREDPDRARAWKDRRIRRALVRYIEDRCIPARNAGPVMA